MSRNALGQNVLLMRHCLLQTEKSHSKRGTLIGIPCYGWEVLQRSKHILAV